MRKMLDLEDRKWLRYKEASLPPPLIGLSDIDLHELHYEVGVIDRKINRSTNNLIVNFIKKNHY